MPKIVSRNVISQSKEVVEETDINKILNVQYCLCGEFLLVIPGPLSSLAIRPIDKSLVLLNKPTATEPEIKVYKLNAVGGIGKEALGVLIKRGKTFEYQRRLHCPRCRLAVGYETVPGAGRKGNATFLLPGSMTDVQNKIPPNAFGDEPEEGE